MKRSTVHLGLAALALAVFAWYWMRPGQSPEPFSTPAERRPVVPAFDVKRGPVVPVADYRLSGPYTHQNLTVFLVHGPETLDAKSFLTLQEALEQSKVVVHETGDVNQLAVEGMVQSRVTLSRAK